MDVHNGEDSVTSIEYQSTVGPLYLFATAQGICGLAFEKGVDKKTLRFECGRSSADPDRALAHLDEATRQLDEYFAGDRTDFDCDLDIITGTPFQKQVWQALRTIPYGQTRSYGQIADAIGKPKAARAVGGANNKNPIAIIIPCHRVIGASGDLVGFGGGLELKRQLLELEGRH